MNDKAAELMALADELHAFCAAAPHEYPGHNLELFERAAAALRLAAAPERSDARAPDGYSKLPQGVVCKCPKMWRGANGDHWCCLLAPATEAAGKLAIHRATLPPTPHVEYSASRGQSQVTYWVSREKGDRIHASAMEAADARDQSEVCKQIMEDHERLHSALKLLWAEVVASDNAESADFGWPKACAATRLALTHPFRLKR